MNKGVIAIKVAGEPATRYVKDGALPVTRARCTFPEYNGSESELEIFGFGAAAEAIADLKVGAQIVAECSIQTSTVEVAGGKKETRAELKVSRFFPVTLGAGVGDEDREASQAEEEPIRRPAGHGDNARQVDVDDDQYDPIPF